MDNLVCKTKEQFKKVAEGVIRRAAKEGSPRMVFSKCGVFADWDVDSENCKKLQKQLHPEAIIGVYDGKANPEYLAQDMKDCGRV